MSLYCNTFISVNIKSLSSDNSLNVNTVLFLHTQILLHILQDCFLVHYLSNQKVISRNQIWLKMLVSLHKRCFRVKEMRYCKSILLYNREAFIWSTFMHTNGRVCVFDIHTKHAQTTYAKSIFQFQVFIRSEIPSSRNEWINVMIFFMNKFLNAALLLVKLPWAKFGFQVPIFFML